MARRKRKSPKRVAAGKKAARTRKRRRRNPRRHRPVVYSTGRGKRKRLRRSPFYRLKPRKVNPRRRRRRNPRRKRGFALKGMTRRYFGKGRMTNAVMLLVGIGASGALKGFSANFLPAGAGKDWYKRLYGILSIILGATFNMRSRRSEIKSIGTGMVVFGLYDVLVSNITQLQAYLPVISPPSAFLPAAETASGNYRSYGRETYDDMMGANIGPGGTEIVGANIGSPDGVEIVGMDDVDLADALDMAA